MSHTAGGLPGYFFVDPIKITGIFNADRFGDLMNGSIGIDESIIKIRAKALTNVASGVIIFILKPW